MARSRQLAFSFRSWGGRRRGAGRPPNGAAAGVSHLRRPSLSHRHPVHVTLRIIAGVPSLRDGRVFTRVRSALAAAQDRFGFRLVHFSVQSNHLHLIAEARDRRSLSLAMQGLSVRVARAVNRRLGRLGRLFAGRYHRARAEDAAGSTLCAALCVAQRAQARSRRSEWCRCLGGYAGGFRRHALFSAVVRWVSAPGRARVWRAGRARSGALHPSWTRQWWRHERGCCSMVASVTVGSMSTMCRRLEVGGGATAFNLNPALTSGVAQRTLLVACRVVKRRAHSQRSSSAG